MTRLARNSSTVLTELPTKNLGLSKMIATISDPVRVENSGVERGLSIDKGSTALAKLVERIELTETAIRRLSVVAKTKKKLAKKTQA